MTESARFENIMGFVARDGERANVVPLPTAPPNNFLALTQRVAAGDDPAAREFFESYCNRIFRYALVMVRGNEELAREILSLTMIKAARYMQPLPSDEDIWRWLTCIARNCFIDHCRKSRRVIPLAEFDEALSHAAAPSTDTTMTVLLGEALSELPLLEQELVERFYFDDQSQMDLAEEIQSTRKAVESRLARIRKKLRAAILQKLS